MGSKLRWISRVITWVLSYLLASAPGGKLLLIPNIYIEDKNVHAAIFNHAWIVVIVLVIAYTTVEIVVFFKNKNKTLETQCHNICRYIYKYIEKTIGKSFAHDLRVTIFKAKKPNTERVYLEAVNRYQVKEPFKKAKVKFKPGEGAVGCCFKTQNLISAYLPEFSEKTAEQYYKESEKYFKLSRDKVRKLNIKSCFFLGIPMKCFDTDRTWGVLLLDSTIKDERFNYDFARKLEEIVEHYTAIFTEGDK